MSLYSSRGNACIPKTIACTSAHKYLPPYDPIYKQWGMYMYRFPGGDVQQTLDTIQPGNPLVIQTYYGKIYDYDKNTWADTINISTFCMDQQKLFAIRAEKDKEPIFLVNSKKYILNVSKEEETNDIKLDISNNASSVSKTITDISGITIGTNVIKLADEVFSGCSNLNNITIYNTDIITHIGNDIFQDICGNNGIYRFYSNNLCKFCNFLLENVVMKKEWEEIITKAIGVEPIMIDSKFFSAQKRQRLYWTNIPFDKNIVDRNINILDILEPKGDEKIINDHPVVISETNNIFKIKNATKLGYLEATNGDCVNLEVPNSKTRRGRVSNGKTNTLNTACNYGVVVNDNIRELNITEYERLQTLPDGFTEGPSIRERKKMIGNGWTIDVISHIFKGIK